MRISRQEGDYEILHINQPTRTNIYIFKKKQKKKRKKKKKEKNQKKEKEKRIKRKQKKYFPKKFSTRVY